MTRKNVDPTQVDGSNGVFLAKSGKIFGPFKTEEFDRMLSEGELESYSWIWSADLQQWKAVDIPPGPPPTVGKEKKGWEHVRAICFGTGFGKRVLSGRIECITETGCELLTDGLTDGLNGEIMNFSKAKSELRIFDEKLKKVESAQVTVMKFLKRDQIWVCRSRWSHVPKVFVNG